MTLAATRRISKVDLWLIRTALHYLRTLAEGNYQNPALVNEVLDRVRVAERNFAVVTEEANVETAVAFPANDVRAAVMALEEMHDSYSDDPIGPALLDVLNKLKG